MTSNFCHRLSITITFFLITGLLTSGTVLALNDQRQVVFLEEFATRLYDRGDKTQALKEFERIRALDPANAKADEYIKKIAAETASPAPRSSTQRLNGAVTDMSGLRTKMATETRSARDLTALVRSLIHENDDLYMVLYKRTRELAAMRARFEGTPYIEEYKRLMKSLPPERVPQRTHQSNELLTLLEREQTTVPGGVNTPPEASHVEGLVQDIIARKKTLETTPKAEALASSLEEKRNTLVETNLTIMDRTKTLDALKAELAASNAALREADARYISMISSIDHYYRNLKTELAQKNFAEQKRFSELLADETAKIAEIEALKKAAAERTAAALPVARENLAAQDRKMAELNQALSVKDQQISAFEATLASCKKELADAQQAADNTSKKVDSIEDLLKDSDQDLAALQAGVSRVRTLMATGTTASAGTTPEIPAGDADLVRELRAEIAQLETRLNAQAHTPAQESVSGGLTASLALLKDQLKEKDALISSLKKDLAEQRTQSQATATALDTANLSIAALREEKDTLRSAGNERDTFLKELSRRLDAMDSSANNKNLALETQNRALGTLTAQIERLDQQMTVAREAFEEKSAALRKTEMENRSLEAALTRLQQKSDQQHHDLASTREELTLLRTTNKALENETSVLMEKLGATPALPAPTTITPTAYSVPVMEKITHPVDLQRLSSLEKALAQKEETITSLQGQLTNKENTANQVRTELKKCQDQAALMRTLVEQKEALSQEIEKLRTKKPDITVVQNLELDIQEKNAQIDQTKTTLNAKERALLQATDEIAKLQDKLTVLELKQKAIRDVVQKRDMETQRLTLALDAQGKDLKEVVAERDALKKRVDNREIAAALAESRLKEREQDLERLQKETNALRVTITNAQAEISRQELEIERYNKGK